jgi:hypothetical protein
VYLPGAWHGWGSKGFYAAKHLGCQLGVAGPTADEAQKQSFAQQLVAQLEPLLYLAYRLQLAPLQEALHCFIRNSTSCGNAILYGHMRPVLTQRLIQAAADSDVGRDALLQLLVAQRGSLAGEVDGLLEPVDAAFRAPVVEFKAKIKKPLPGLTPGDVVDVELDLNECRLKVGGIVHRMQLLVGSVVDTAPRMQVMLGQGEAASSKSP